MKTPRYTDGRYPNGYRKSVDTDIRKTFERMKREAREEEERKKAAFDSKVQSILKARK